MIVECKVLLGVKNFKQRSRRVAAKIHPKLVHLIEHDQRVDRSRFFHHLNDLSRQRADVCPAMPAYLGFVAHAAQAQANKLAAGRLSDRTPEAGLADTRWTDETKNRTFRSFYQLTNGKVFKDALFDFFQTVMITFQNFLRSIDVADLF